MKDSVRKKKIKSKKKRGIPMAPFLFIFLILFLIALPAMAATGPVTVDTTTKVLVSPSAAAFTTANSILLTNGAGGSITLDASGFNGNLATTDNTLQEVAQKLDDLSSGLTVDTSAISGGAVGTLLFHKTGNVLGEITAGVANQVLMGGGTGNPPVWTLASGTGTPILQTSPLLVTPSISGTITFGDGTGATAILASSLSGATDPTITLANDAITASSPVLFAGGGSASTPGIAWATDADGSGTGIYRSAANALSIVNNGTEKHRFTLAGELVLGTNGAGGATTATRLTGAVTAFTDATPKRACRITVPNAAHSAMVRVTIVGSLGAGGAIGANEASQTISYDIGVARTAGVAMNAVISTAYGSSGSVAVVGADTITVVAAITLNAEGVGVSNTADVMVTITKGGGASANHTCRVLTEVVNANASGVLITIP